MKKPLGKRCYGSVPHLPGSRVGPGEHHITEGQARIATVEPRDKHDIIVCQEKLDGSNVGVALKGGKLFALTRAGYEAHTSPYPQHHAFARFVRAREPYFRIILREGERLCGEWLMVAHGTRYDLPHEPFVPFDLFTEDNDRLLYEDLLDRVSGLFVLPHVIAYGNPVSIEEAMGDLEGPPGSGFYGNHGALEPVEGAIWRVERKGKVDFLCKYVRHDKEDGKYLGGPDLLNEWGGDWLDDSR